MSSGARMPFFYAERVIEALREKWCMPTTTVYVAGSVRRRCAEVGDIDLLAPAVADGARDELYERIAATVDNPPPKDSIFEQARTAPPGAIGTAVRGLKPGFAACDLIVRPWKSIDVKVQVCRYTPENLGWMLIYKTGPVEFGRWFLGKWKRRHGIPVGDDRFAASIDGHLVGHDRKVIPVESEEQAFERCGLQPVPPHHREAFMQRVG